jgi:myo-inositol-1(or 4)-monophosphatase
MDEYSVKTANSGMLSIALDAAQQAGKTLLRYYGTSIETMYKTEHKDVGSIVSVADLASQKEIVGRIRAAYPSHGIYGEEGDEQQTGAVDQWYVDPLDGTSNYLRNIPLWGISIGYLRNGIPEVGVLHFPALEMTVYATNGEGAWLLKDETCRRLSVSKRAIGESLYYAGGKFKGASQIEPAITQQCGLVKIIDASSYELAQIAMGDAELYVLTSVPHDVAAGVVIVQEAGGKVTDGSGMPWSLDSKRIIASNGVIHADVVSILEGR